MKATATTSCDLRYLSLIPHPSPGGSNLLLHLPRFLPSFLPSLHLRSALLRGGRVVSPVMSFTQETASRENMK